MERLITPVIPPFPLVQPLGLLFEGTGTLNHDSPDFSPDAFLMNSGTIYNSLFGNMFSDGTSNVVINGGSTDNDGGNFADGAVSLIINGGSVTNGNAGEMALGAYFGYHQRWHCCQYRWERHGIKCVPPHFHEWGTL